MAAVSVKRSIIYKEKQGRMGQEIKEGSGKTIQRLPPLKFITLKSHVD